MKRAWHRGFGGLLIATTAVAASLTPRTAHAVEFGAGLIGVAGGNFQDKPDRTGLQPDINPGFGGLTIGGGLMLDLRFIELIGLEVDVIRSGDHGTGTVSFNGYHNKVTIGQGAWHVPILAKVTIPSPVVAPAFFIGPEIVAPSAASTSVDPPLLAAAFTQKADTYVMLTLGAGVEIKLPLPVLDLRIPIGLRGSYAPGVSSNFADRTSTNGTSIVYRSEWKFAVNATLGAALYF
jgi:hypothetical protein